ncbi:MAG: type IV toxin-antitoxin system AbiEi family antitoxin [Lentisphaerota bacterium]
MDGKNDILKSTVETFNRNNDIKLCSFSLDRLNPSGQFVFGKRKVEVAFLVKSYMNRSRIGLVLNELHSLSVETGKPAILVTKHVNPIIAEELKKTKSMFLDSVGNACLSFGDIFIFIKGNTYTGEIKETSPKSFNASDIRMIFNLLNNPVLLNKSYREIALQSKISLGKVGGVMKNLKAKGYLVNLNNQESKLINMKKLLDEWCVAYRERLRAKLKIANYTAENSQWWKNADLTDKTVCWDGEVAGAEITGILQPQNITVYSRGNIGPFILKNKLRKHPSGNVEIIEAFWESYGNQKLAPDIVVFADLITSGNSRNIGTAELLYEKRLKKRFE